MPPHPVVLCRLARHAEQTRPQRGDRPLSVRAAGESRKPLVETQLELIRVLARNQIVRFESSANDGSRPTEDGRDFFLAMRRDGGHALVRIRAHQGYITIDEPVGMAGSSVGPNRSPKARLSDDHEAQVVVNSSARNSALNLDRKGLRLGTRRRCRGSLVRGTIRGDHGLGRGGGHLTLLFAEREAGNGIKSSILLAHLCQARKRTKGGAASPLTPSYRLRLGHGCHFRPK